MRTYCCYGIIHLLYSIRHDYKDFQELNQIELLNNVRHNVMPKFEKDKKALQYNLSNVNDIRVRLTINLPHEEVSHDVIVAISFHGLHAVNELKTSQIQDIFSLDTLFQFDCLERKDVRIMLLSCLPVNYIKN